MLLGREHERQEIEVALVRARSGRSAALAFVGEPGIGKTVLLDYAAERAAGMRQLTARGVESEAQIPFGSLLELLRPALALLDQIPGPQAMALEGALALRPGSAQDRFAIGAATLSLLAVFAETAPVAVLIDDAHWLDESSAQALLFAFRRLVADPIAVLITVREGESSLLDGADLRMLQIGGLTTDEIAELLPEISHDTATRLRSATAGNPLAVLELASDIQDLAYAPDGAPMIVSARISRAFLRRASVLDEPSRRALVLAAVSESGDLALLARAASQLGIDLSALTAAESTGLLALQAGVVEFRHPLARSAIYANAPLAERRDAHRAVATVLPDRDGDRRAWHLAAAAAGTDEAASAALEQAGGRARDRSAYASAAAAFERGGRLAADVQRRARLLRRSAEAAWLAGSADRAIALLDEARTDASDPGTTVEIDQLAGHIATRRGLVMHGCAILTATAERADPELAVAMLGDAAIACLYAGNAAEMLSVAKRARAHLSSSASLRSRFLAATTMGMAQILGGDGEAGAEEIREAISMAEGSAALRDDLELFPWLAMAPMFLRQTGRGRSLLDRTLATARARAAIGALPFVLNLVARDLATGHRTAEAEATYREAIDLARESGQLTEVALGLSGLAWLQARHGAEEDCRTSAAEAIRLCADLGMGLPQIWATAALGELELGTGDVATALEHFQSLQRLLQELSITDADLSPAADLVEAHVRLGRKDSARAVADDFAVAAAAKGQPWSLAKSMRCQGLLAPVDAAAPLFERALSLHEETPDRFEAARTRLAYGEHLRRTRNRLLAREQLRAAAEIFEGLDAHPWAERARAELAATGETRLRRDISTIDKLTPQELQIAVHLTAGRTTRETAAALFVSPKTVEYHLRHIYQRLDIHSRDELAQVLASAQVRAGETGLDS